MNTTNRFIQCQNQQINQGALKPQSQYGATLKREGAVTHHTVLDTAMSKGAVTTAASRQQRLK